MGSIIAITGMSGAGKSTVLSNLAYALTANGNIVGCLSCDLSYPSLPSFFHVDIPSGKSLGKLFDKEKPASDFVECEEKSNLFVSAPASGEDCTRYEPPEFEVLELFLERLSSAFDYVLIKAGEFVLNSFSAKAILNADEIINVIPCRVQGKQHDDSYYNTLLSCNPNVTPINVLNFADEVIRAKDFALEHPVFVHLPSHISIRASVDIGLPVIRAKEKNRAVRAYCTGIQAIAKRLMEGGVDE